MGSSPSRPAGHPANQRAGGRMTTLRSRQRGEFAYNFQCPISEHPRCFFHPQHPAQSAPPRSGFGAMRRRTGHFHCNRWSCPWRSHCDLDLFRVWGHIHRACPPTRPVSPAGFFLRPSVHAESKMIRRRPSHRVGMFYSGHGTEFVVHPPLHRDSRNNLFRVS